MGTLNLNFLIAARELGDLLNFVPGESKSNLWWVGKTFGRTLNSLSILKITVGIQWETITSIYF
jgi:hypothetical protein